MVRNRGDSLLGADCVLGRNDVLGQYGESGRPPSEWKQWGTSGQACADRVDASRGWVDKWMDG